MNRSKRISKKNRFFVISKSANCLVQRFSIHFKAHISFKEKIILAVRAQFVLNLLVISTAKVNNRKTPRKK